MHVLFVCTHNSARSQMAEGLLRERGGDRFQAASAGTTPGRLHPLAVRAMAEIGIDISGQQAEAVEMYTADKFDLVITVCDEAKESCPVLPGAAHQLHWSLPDPSTAEGPESGRLDAFRGVRDTLSLLINDLVAGVKP
jgi:arsenate reductase